MNIRLQFLTVDELSIYGVNAAGELIWSSIQYPLPAYAAKVIGTGWNSFRQLISGGNGVLYGIQPTGELLWYKDEARDGTVNWNINSGNQIGVGWQNFIHVFSGGDGVFYTVKSNGDMLWYKDELQNGTNSPLGNTGWHGQSGMVIGSSFDRFMFICSGGNGIIYAIEPSGDLYLYKVITTTLPSGDLSIEWDPASNRKINDGWHNYNYVFSAPGGEIFGVATQEYGANLYKYNLPIAGDFINLNWDKRKWVAEHWQIAEVEGYCWPLSVRGGHEINFFVSSLHDQNGNVSIVEMEENDDGTYGITRNTMVFAFSFQATDAKSFKLGCNWRLTFSFFIPTDWKSGLYAAKCVTENHNVYYILFTILSPVSFSNKLLTIINTNTWNAYNTWGGLSNYNSYDSQVRLSLQRPNLHLMNCKTDHMVGNHMVRSEIWFSDWLKKAGYESDFCNDSDLHAGELNLSNYKALLLNTHPEYWSATMYGRLQHYLNEGGTLIYLGGNGIYRVVDYVAGFTAFVTSQFDPFLLRNNGRPEMNLLGVDYPSATGAKFCLISDHPFFRNTGLSIGDSFGNVGREGNSILDWETDENDPEQKPVKLLASALLPSGEITETVQMITYNTTGDGFVFSAGSITFVASLIVDNKVQTIVKNVINKAMGL